MTNEQPTAVLFFVHVTQNGSVLMHAGDQSAATSFCLGAKDLNGMLEPMRINIDTHQCALLHCAACKRQTVRKPNFEKSRQRKLPTAAARVSDMKTMNGTLETGHADGNVSLAPISLMAEAEANAFLQQVCQC